MMPPVFATCFASNAVKALIGTTPCRIFPFGLAPEQVVKPYAVWQVITGTPDNTLDDCGPHTDRANIQIDVYADTAAVAESVTVALRDAIEPVAYVTRWGGQTRDPETLNYRITFGVDWIVYR